MGPVIVTVLLLAVGAVALGLLRDRGLTKRIGREVDERKHRDPQG
jgi:hypothetical protein